MSSEDFNNKKTNSKMNKFWVILALLLILLIPIGLMHGIVSDRENYSFDATTEITNSWGNAQCISSPVVYFMKNKEAVYLPLKNYSADVQLNTEVRKRGIFKVPLYTADIKIKGYFQNEYGRLNDKDLNFKFKVSDSLGFIQEPILKLNNKEISLQNTEYKTKLNTSSTVIPFEISYKLRGARDFDVEINGEKNNIKISGNWENPSFNGDFLPTNRTVEVNSFNAEWSIPFIAASEKSKPYIRVSLLMKIDNYRMADRTLKYAFMFLALTFLSYFIFEVVSGDKKTRIHPLQYLILGGGMLMFYLLLVSISELCSFAVAYSIASIMVISLITTYTYFVITKRSNKAFTLTVASLMTALYTFLYLLLSLQDLALLAGSCGLFIIIAVIMYVTRNVDWYND